MPTFEFTSPDGKTYEVTGPEGATQEQAFELLKPQLGQTSKSYLTQSDLAGPQAAPQQQAGAGPADEPVTAGGIYKAVDRGAANAAAGIASLPRTVGTLGAQGIQGASNWVAGKLGLEQDTRDLTKQGLIPLPNAEEAGAAIQRDLYGGAAPYEPQNRTERYAQRGGENLLNAIMPGGLATKAASVIAPAILGEATKEMGGGAGAQIGAELLGGIGVSKTAQALSQRAARAANPAPHIQELGDAASPVYKQLTKEANTIAVPQLIDENLKITSVGKQFAADIGADLHPLNLRPESAPRTYRQLNKLSQLGETADLNDVATIRDKLRDTQNGVSNMKLVTIPERDAKAAGLAKEALDKKMDELAPGWVARNAEADGNWAAKRRIGTVEKYEEEGKRLTSFDKNQTRAKGYTKTELALIKRAETGGKLGTVLNTFGSVLNPAHGGLPAAVGAAAHLPMLLMTGGASFLPQVGAAVAGGVADLGAKALRKRAYNRMIEKLGQRSPLGAPTILPPIHPLSRFKGGQYALPGILADPSQRQLLLGN